MRSRQALQAAEEKSQKAKIANARNKALAISRSNSFSEDPPKKYSVLNDSSRLSSGNRSRTSSNDKTNCPVLGRGVVNSDDMDLLHQKLSALPSAAFIEARLSRNASRAASPNPEEEEVEYIRPTSYRHMCKENRTPFSTAPNSRAPSPLQVRGNISYGSMALSTPLTSSPAESARKSPINFV
jgi:hypothetical protein